MDEHLSVSHISDVRPSMFGGAERSSSGINPRSTSVFVRGLGRSSPAFFMETDTLIVNIGFKMKQKRKDGREDGQIVGMTVIPAFLNTSVGGLP